MIGIRSTAVWITALLMGVASAMVAHAQCTNIIAFGTAVAPTSSTPLTISTCTFQDEYNTITGVVAGQTYSVGSSCGGYVTVRRNTYDGVLVANGTAPLTFTAPAAGTYFLHFNTNAACGAGSTCCTTTITCTSCTGPSGCVNTVAFGTVAAPITPAAQTISTCTFQNEYNTITGVVPGRTYTIGSTCGGYVTVRHTTFNGTVVAQGNAPLTFTATVAGTYHIHYNTGAACGTASICCTTTISCTSCNITPPAGACTAINIPGLPVTGQAVSCHASNLITSANVTSLCGTASTFYLEGNEALYTVTPTTSGSYAINYGGQTWSSIWVFSGACPAAGGICVGSVSNTTASQTLIVTMTAGVQYWILFDTFPSPPSPCPGSFSIANVPPPVVASDCNQAVNVCTNINFQIDPNGSGSTNEIPPLGSLGNPDYGPLSLIPPYYNTWGTTNEGCLRGGELNSTWMVVNVLTGGTLEFNFGGLGTQTGFYDWIMYPFSTTSCAQVSSGLVAPVRCNWNGVSFGGTGLAAAPPAGGDASNFEPPINVVAGSRWLICFSNWSSVTTAVPLQFGGTAVVSCSPLPLELLAFEATSRTGHVELEWLTGSETGSSHFIVERSRDALNWNDLFTVAAAGSSQELRAYNRVDAAPLIGTAFYRLRMVDLDESFSYSEVRQVESHTSLHVAPNPAKGAFTVFDAPDGATVRLLDIMGREHPVSMARTGASGTLSIDPHSAPAGVYTLSISVGQGASIARVVLENP